MEEEIIQQEEITEPEPEIIEPEPELEPEDIDEIDFDDDEGLYVIGSYDLNAYKEELGLDNSDNLEKVTNWIAGFEEAGFTQEQIDFLIKKELADDDEEEPEKKPKTKLEIKAELNKALTIEERRNYNSVKSYVTGLLGEGELAQYKDDILHNPNLVKLFNLVYKDKIGKQATGKVNGGLHKPQEKRVANVSIDDAFAQIQTTLSKKGDVKKLVKELTGRVNDKDSFAQLIKTMGIK